MVAISPGSNPGESWETTQVTFPFCGITRIGLPQFGLLLPKSSGVILKTSYSQDQAAILRGHGSTILSGEGFVETVRGESPLTFVPTCGHLDRKPFYCFSKTTISVKGLPSFPVPDIWNVWVLPSLESVA